MRRHSCKAPRPVGIVQFLFFVLQLVQPIIDATLREQFLMRTLFAETALVKNEDAVGVLDGAEAMGNYESGATREQTVQRFTNKQFGFGIHAGSRFIQNQETRIVRKRSTRN